ncbi:inosine-5'-monophosphate dehydrogenase [archaeon]|nr:inosine-5'-monophosphate dehydrogenase [archaeon]
MIKLTPVQREVLVALVDLYHKLKGDAVKGEDIAEVIKKNPGTIRNQMQSLRSLGLVEGVPGPKGGYRPTAECYSILHYEEDEKEVAVPIRINGKPVEDVNITGIELLSIHRPETCRSRINYLGDLKSLDIGESIIIGPTPVNKLIISGKIIGRDDIDNVLLIEVTEMVSIPKEKVCDIALKNIKYITPDYSIRDAARFFVKTGIRGAPVMAEGKAVGIITNSDIAEAVAQDMENGIVKDIMSTTIITINKDAPLYLAVELIEENNISRLLVVDNNNNVKGVVTRRDLLCRIFRLLGHAIF